MIFTRVKKFCDLCGELCVLFVVLHIVEHFVESHGYALSLTVIICFIGTGLYRQIEKRCGPGEHQDVRL